MPPTFLLAHLHARASLHRTAHSALPWAPVQPYTPRWRRLRRLSRVLGRRLPAGHPTRDANHEQAIECTPIC